MRGDLLWRLRRACVVTYQENGLAISKGAAYSALLSFFPVLTTTAAILVQVKARAVSQVLSRYLTEVVPPGTQDIVLTRFAVSGQRPLSVLVIATLVSLYAASGVMLSLMEGFNAVYHVPVGRPFLRQRGIAALLVFLAALPALGASALMLFGARVERWVVGWLSGRPNIETLTGWVAVAGRSGRLLIALGGIVLGTAILYRIGPHRRMRWRNVWGGAVLATALWLVATEAFGWYVRSLASYNLMYGGIATAIALIVWMYLLAVISIFGCAFNAVSEQAESSRG